MKVVYIHVSTATAVVGLVQLLDDDDDHELSLQQKIFLHAIVMHVQKAP